ncbi:MAG TPA: hypothetical protein VHZ27_13295 [Solirubrobacteraceae bacterium]|nr:hypothetical protein [Solirubrobacteraceae bacterium]
MASQRSKRRSRKRHNPGTARARSLAPREGSPEQAAGRPEGPVGRSGSAGRSEPRPRRRRAGAMGAYGERPPSPFGGLPVAEISILVGAVVLIIGVIDHATVALIGGVVICLFGVVEVTTREHFSGYRSHTVLLAAIPAVAAEFVIAVTVGTPAIRALLLIPVGVVFAICAYFLRKRFLFARQARIARPQKL